MDCWYGIFVDSQHLGYMHLEAKQILVANQKRWETRVDFSVNPTPSDATAAERRITRSLTRQDGALLEEWETLTSDGETTMTHWTYQGKKVLVEKTEPGKPPTRKFVVNNDGKPLHDTFFFPAELTGSVPKKALPTGWKLYKDEIITVDYQPISAIRVTMAGHKDGSKGSFWIDRDRQLVRADIHLSDYELRLERMAAKSAVRASDTASPPGHDNPPYIFRYGTGSAKAQLCRLESGRPADRRDGRCSIYRCLETAGRTLYGGYSSDGSTSGGKRQSAADRD